MCIPVASSSASKGRSRCKGVEYACHVLEALSDAHDQAGKSGGAVPERRGVSLCSAVRSEAGWNGAARMASCQTEGLENDHHPDRRLDRRDQAQPVGHRRVECSRRLAGSCGNFASGEFGFWPADKEEIGISNFNFTGVSLPKPQRSCALLRCSIASFLKSKRECALFRRTSLLRSVGSSIREQLRRNV